MILTTENASSPASAQGSGGNAPTLALARLTPRLRLVLAIVLIADVLDLMDSTTTNIAAPTIVREIGGGESPVKWLGASYALAIGVLLVVGGRLGDRFGKRRMFLIGIAGFGLASVFCGLSIGPTMLIAGRFVQGGFGAVLIPQGAGLLLKTFSGKQFPVVAMVFGLVLGGSAVLRPIVAGVIISAKIDRLNWRPMFLINIGLSVIGFVAGAVLLGAAMVGLTYGLIGGSTDGWTVAPIANIVAGVLLFGAFAVGQRTAAGPLLFAEPAGQPRVHLRLAARLDLFRRGQRLRLRRLTVLPALAAPVACAGLARPVATDGGDHRFVVLRAAPDPQTRPAARRGRPAGHPRRGHRVDQHRRRAAGSHQLLDDGPVDPWLRYRRLLQQHLRRRRWRCGAGRGRQRQRIAQRRPATGIGDRLRRRHHRLLRAATPQRRPCAAHQPHHRRRHRRPMASPWCGCCR